MAPEARYCVFRIVNQARKEVFLVATSKPIFQAISEMDRSRPPALLDWDLSDVSKFESLEFNLNRDAALAFVNARVESGKRRGYRYILEIRD